MDRLKQYLNENPSDDIHSSEIVNILKDLDDKSFYKSLSSIPKELIAKVALELPDRYFEDVIENFSDKDIALSLTELESDDQTDFIQELEDRDRRMAKNVFNFLHEDDQADILQLKQYSEYDAGAYMQLEVYTAKLQDSVKGIIKEFVKLRKKNELENVNYLFGVQGSGDANAIVI